MDADPEETNAEAEPQPNGSGPAPKRRARLTPAQKRAKLEAELRAVEMAELEERQRIAKTPEGRMNNLEAAVGDLARGMADMMAMMRQGPPMQPSLVQPARFDEPMLRLPHGPPPMFEKVMKWWTNAQPLLRNCWMLSKFDGTDPFTMQQAIKALAELYENAHKNITGEMPSETHQPSTQKFDLNDQLRRPIAGGDAAAEEAMWRRG